MLGKVGVLLIHGFAGGTYDLEFIQNNLELVRKFDVFSFTLPGHERALSKVKYTSWIEKSEEMVKWLIDNNYNTIYLVGHSMGCIISCYLASKYPQIKKIVLAAPCFNYLKVENDNLNISDSIKASGKVFKTYGSKEIVGRALKLDISATKEFMNLVKKYYAVPTQIKCPVLIIQGTKDDLAPISSSYYVYNNVKSKVKKLVIVEGATHETFKGEKRDQIYKIIKSFLKHRQKGGEYKI